MNEKQLSPLQKKYKEIFGNLNCPFCNNPIDWDIHKESDWDWGMCSNDFNCDVLITEDQDIIELKERLK